MLCLLVGVGGGVCVGGGRGGRGWGAGAGLVDDIHLRVSVCGCVYAPARADVFTSVTVGCSRRGEHDMRQTTRRGCVCSIRNIYVARK